MPTTSPNLMSHDVESRLLSLNEMLSYHINDKECDFSCHMIYYLCFYALSIHFMLIGRSCSINLLKLDCGKRQ